MQTDRELLEAAARAAGLVDPQYYYYKPEIPFQDFPTVECITHLVNGDPHRKNWNPLRDDGDALRLAVECGIDIFFDGKEVEAIAYLHGKEVDGETLYPSAIERFDSDKYAATRRAIVRAAAQIGREG